VDVLLVEDDEAIAQPLVKGLEREGFNVNWVATGGAAVDAADADVVLLDLGLPDIDGYEVCRRLRAKSDVPVIFLTARSDEVDRVVGLELGADDYVVKPFGFRELVARIRAVTRRRSSPPRAEVQTQQIGALELDRRTRKVTMDGRELDLTPKEFDLVALLSQDPGAVFPRQQIMERVWGHPWYGPTKTLDVHVASIRKKLGDPGWIETVRGVGFRLQPPELSSSAPADSVS
jgi:DNA-binding response OmpR family regulator